MKEKSKLTVQKIKSFLIQWLVLHTNDHVSTVKHMTQCLWFHQDNFICRLHSDIILIVHFSKRRKQNKQIEHQSFPTVTCFNHLQIMLNCKNWAILFVNFDNSSCNPRVKIPCFFMLIQHDLKKNCLQIWLLMSNKYSLLNVYPYHHRRIKLNLLNDLK
jgi:hypothetical protein